MQNLAACGRLSGTGQAGITCAISMYPMLSILNFHHSTGAAYLGFLVWMSPVSGLYTLIIDLKVVG